MKNLVFSLLLISSFLSAQGRQDDADGLQASAGFAENKEMLGTLAYTHIFNETTWMGKVGLLYKDSNFKYIGDQNIKLNFYGINAQAGYSVEALSPVLLNFWAGLYGGYEIVNNNKNKDPYYQAPFPYGTKGIRYGVSLEPEIEINFGKTMSFVTSYVQFFSINSKYIVRDYSVLAGFKFYINH